MGLFVMPAPNGSLLIWCLPVGRRVSHVPQEAITICRLASPCASVLGTEPCFEDVSNRVMSEVPVDRAWADRCVVAEAVENLSAQGALRVWRCCKAVRMRSPSQSKMRSWSLPPNRLPLLGLMEFEGGLVLLWGLLHPSIQSVRETHVGQVALIARCAARVPPCVVVDGAAELCPLGSHVAVLLACKNQVIVQRMKMV